MCVLREQRWTLVSSPLLSRSAPLPPLWLQWSFMTSASALRSSLHRFPQCIFPVAPSSLTVCVSGSGSSWPVFPASLSHRLSYVSIILRIASNGGAISRFLGFYAETLLSLIGRSGMPCARDRCFPSTRICFTAGYLFSDGIGCGWGNYPSFYFGLTQVTVGCPCWALASGSIQVTDGEFGSLCTVSLNGPCLVSLQWSLFICMDRSIILRHILM